MNYSNELKLKAKQLYEEHKNYCVVARILNVSSETVRYWLNPKLREKVKKYMFKNKEKLNLYNKTYFQKTKKERTNYHKLYCIKHKLDVKQWTSNYKKRRWENDPNFKIRIVLASRIRRVLKIQNVTKTNKTLELTGCTIQQLKQHLEKQFKPGMTWNNHGEWHIDHVIPCSLFDLTKEEEQRKCFHYTNLQPLWANDNLTKSNRV